MTHSEFTPRCTLKYSTPFGISLVMGVLVLVQTGCTRVPQPAALELEIDEDTSTEITLSTADTFKSQIYYQISTLPQHGSITNAPSTNNELSQSPMNGTPPVVSYTPVPNYFGNDEFEYVIRKEKGRVSEPATVRIVISAVNDPPVAEPMLVITAVDTAVTIQPQAIDVDGRIVQYEIVSSPNRGEVVHEGEMFRFTPQPNFLGDDSFEYVAIDDWGLRSAKTQVTVRTSLLPQEEEVSVESPTDVQEPKRSDTVPTKSTTTQVPDSITSTKTPGNSLPVAEDLEMVLLEDTAAQLELKATDSDGTIARYGITTLPAHGILSGAGTKRTYTPLPDFFGTDSFAYVGIDNQGGVSTPAIVSISVDSVNDIPSVESSHWAIVEDSSGLYLDLMAQDPDGMVVSTTIVRAPSNGTLDDVGSGRWLYVPEKNFSGYDSFDWVAIDDEGDRSLEATVTLNVQEQPDPPSIRLRESNYYTTVGEQLDIRAIVTDPDNDADWFEIRTGARPNGKFIPSRGSISELVYLRFEATKRGISTYALEVRDRSGLTKHATFTIEVTNTPPEVEFPLPSYDRNNQTVSFSLRARDPDGTIDHFVIQTIDNRRAGSITVNGSAVTDAQSFTTGGACETEDGAWCTLNVKYKPDVIDGHSRRIRVYAVDDEGAASPKDFIRIETNQLKVAYHVEDDNKENNAWTPPSPRVPPYQQVDPPAPVVRPPTNSEESTVEVEIPVTPVEEPDPVVEPEEQDSEEVILKRIDEEEIKQVTDPNREVPRDRR